MRYHEDMTTAEIDRFERYIPGYYDKNGCLIWTGTVNDQGRGIFWMWNRWHVASRIIHSLHNRVDMPNYYEDGRRCVIAHECHQVGCVHTDHLVMTDQSTNMLMSYRDKKIPIGRRRWNSKLTEHIVIRCRKLYHKKGVGATKLARLYGVSKNTMLYACTGKQWSHITEGLPAEDK
jgi:hypothetical protein